MKVLQDMADARFNVCCFCNKKLCISEFTYKPTEVDNKSLYCKQCESDSFYKYRETNNNTLNRIKQGTSLSSSDLVKHKDLIECYKISKLIKNK